MLLTGSSHSAHTHHWVTRRQCQNDGDYGQRFYGPSLHGKGVEHAAVVSCPHLTATVAHRQQVRAQLEMDRLVKV